MKKGHRGEILVVSLSWLDSGAGQGSCHIGRSPLEEMICFLIQKKSSLLSSILVNTIHSKLSKGLAVSAIQLKSRTF